MQLRSNKSTTGRSYVVPALGRLARALERVAPPAAGALVARAFLTPPRFRAPAAERASLHDAVPFPLRVDGELLHGFRMGEGPAVLLVHGWGGRGGQLATLAAPLVAAGCTVVGFDGPAHGRSSGRTASVVSFAAAAAAFARASGARAAVGHSLGAAALSLAVARGLRLEAVALLAPPRAPGVFFERFCAALGVSRDGRERARARVEARLRTPMADLDVGRLAASLATPALVVHDREDVEVPCEHGVAVAGSWPGARLLLTSGLGHRRILKDAGVAMKVADFVLERLSRCACGRLASEVSLDGARCATCALDGYLAVREARGPRAAA